MPDRSHRSAWREFGHTVWRRRAIIHRRWVAPQRQKLSHRRNSSSPDANKGSLSLPEQYVLDHDVVSQTDISSHIESLRSPHKCPVSPRVNSSESLAEERQPPLWPRAAGVWWKNPHAGNPWKLAAGGIEVASTVSKHCRFAFRPAMPSKGGGEHWRLSYGDRPH